MTVQRRRGLPAVFFIGQPHEDERGNVQLIPDMSVPYKCKVAEYPQRSAKSEVPGQQQVDVTRLLVPWEVGSVVNLRSRLWYREAWWDIAAPPAPHFGPRRHTRHWSIDVRRRTEELPPWQS